MKFLLFPPPKAGGGRCYQLIWATAHFSSCMREKSETTLKNNLGNRIYYYIFLSYFCR
ncbi:MAG: hypothetical protein LBR79_01015 [Oscillospiraceae bacterium]|nr:hypothetical protein [Oscillospiraceae bacterium]